MKIINIILLIIIGLNLGGVTLGEPSYTLKAGVSMASKVPQNFFGTWRVVSKLVNTTNYGKFKPQSLDLWNLSRRGDVINLNNPMTGADATITVKTVENGFIKFSKKGVYDTQVLTDTVVIKLGDESFTGYNDLTLESLSNVDGHVIKVEHAKYSLKGERISGAAVK